MKRDISTIFWDNLTDYKRRHYSIPEEELEGLKRQIVDINTDLALEYMLRRKGVGPFIGDFLILPDGRVERFVCDYGDKVQTYENGSFNLGDNGLATYSGTCGDLWEKRYISKTREKNSGSCWVWDRGRVGPSMGVPVKAQFDVYVYCKTKAVEDS